MSKTRTAADQHAAKLAKFGLKDVGAEFVQQAIQAGKKDTACVTCGHDPYEQKETPLMQFIHSFMSPQTLRYIATLISGIAFTIANNYLLPKGAFDNLVSGIHSGIMLLPSITIWLAMWAALFAAKHLEGTSNILMMIESERLYKLWITLMIGSFFGLILVLMVTEFSTWVMEVTE